MKTPLDTRVEKLKQQGYDLSLNKVLDDAFSAWKKILFMGIVYVLFSYLFSNLVSLFLSNILGTKDLDTEFSNSIMSLSQKPNGFTEMIPLFQEYMYNPLILSKAFISSFINLLIFPMGAGLIYCAYQADKTGTTSFKDLIRGFQGNKFINLLGLTIIVSVVTLLSAFLLFIPLLYIIPAFLLAGAFIIIDEVSLSKAIKNSIKIVNMNFGKVLLVSVVSFLISKVLGVAMCGIGLIITIPYSFAIVYSVYKNTIETVKTEDISE
ncbi:hypothetical protein O2K51_09000 [Apibacter raozihei]|uniref:hypothetical protein n=1 Tax=Apibacter TaxID=1778601 RepID=UPI000FE4025B|nr:MULTISPECIES: hypothetical protein [Apibacter]